MSIISGNNDQIDPIDALLEDVHVKSFGPNCAREAIPTPQSKPLQTKPMLASVQKRLQNLNNDATTTIDPSEFKPQNWNRKKQKEHSLKQSQSFYPGLSKEWKENVVASRTPSQRQKFFSVASSLPEQGEVPIEPFENREVRPSLQEKENSKACPTKSVANPSLQHQPQPNQKPFFYESTTDFDHFQGIYADLYGEQYLERLEDELEEDDQSFYEKQKMAVQNPVLSSVIKPDYLAAKLIKEKYSDAEQKRLDPHPRSVGISSSAVSDAAMKAAMNEPERIEEPVKLPENPKPLAAAPVPPAPKQEEGFFEQFFSILKFLIDLFYRHP